MNQPVFSLNQLQSLHRAIPDTFSILLPSGDILQCEKVLRLLPGKRIVTRAIHHGATVLAKVFFDEIAARKEIRGYLQLEKNGIKTPALLQQLAVESGCILVYEFVHDVQALDDFLRSANATEKQKTLCQLLDLLAAFYRAEICQKDLHPGNFLCVNNRIIALDPGSIAPVKSRDDMLDNLALLLAQLPVSDRKIAIKAIAARFEFIKPNQLEQRADKQGQTRQKAYQDKILRDCTEVADLSTDNLRILVRRDALSPALEALLRNPQLLQENARLLKAGNSATVSAIAVDGQNLVIKEYRDKDWLRKTRRLFRPSRAARSWVLSHALAQVEIDVAAPVALIEKKCGLFVTSAWFISHQIDGESLLSGWKKREPLSDELACVANLFSALAHHRISHGDMKASNLISTGSKIFLIDFDGAKTNCTKAALERDRQRFLRNWHNPQLTKMLSGIIST